MDMKLWGGKKMQMWLQKYFDPIVYKARYSSPPQLRYPQLSYFRSSAILNWVQKNSS